MGKDAEVGSVDSGVEMVTGKTRENGSADKLGNVGGSIVDQS